MAKSQKKLLSSVLKKFFLTLFFLVFILVLIEFSIRGLGWFFIHKIRHHPKDEASKEEFLISCFGDSHIAGVGAPLKMSFPSQLEELLNKYCFTGKKFVVKNFGIGGINSSQTLEEFYKLTKDETPDIALVMTGLNNSWNFQKLRILQKSKDQNLKSLKNRVLLFLTSLRIYKTFLYLSHLDDIAFYEHTFIPEDLKQKSGDMEFFIQSVQEDFSQMKKIASERRFELIFLTYPIEKSNHYIYPALQRENLEFIDIAKFFKSVLDNFPELVLSSDSYHPNILGYRLIAFAVFSYLLKHNKTVSINVRSLEFMENFERIIEQKDVAKLLTILLADKPLATQPITELSNENDKFEKAYFLAGDVPIEFIIRNNELFYIHYPENCDQFNDNILKKRPSTQLLNYLIGKPLYSEKFPADANFTHFDCQSLYYCKGKEMSIFSKDGKGLFAFYDLENSVIDQLKMLDWNLSVQEIKAIFGDPLKESKENPYLWLIYCSISRKLRLKIKDNHLVEWSFKELHFNRSIVNTIKNHLQIGDPSSNVFQLIGEPKRKFNLKSPSNSQLWLKQNMAILIRNDCLENIFIFDTEVDEISLPSQDLPFEEILNFLKSETDCLVWKMK